MTVCTNTEILQCNREIDFKDSVNISRKSVNTHNTLVKHPDHSKHPNGPIQILDMSGDRGIILNIKKLMHNKEGTPYNVRNFVCIKNIHTKLLT